jgi:hypothetical protein
VEENEETMRGNNDKQARKAQASSTTSLPPQKFKKSHNIRHCLARLA